jgi:hypothetical protein
VLKFLQVWEWSLVGLRGKELRENLWSVVVVEFYYYGTLFWELVPADLVAQMMGSIPSWSLMQR